MGALTKKEFFAGTENQLTSLFNGDKQKRDRFMATAYQASQNSNIANCTGQSVMNAIIQTAQLDLSIDPQIGQAYMVPYKSNATLQIGYRGWVALLKRYGFDIKAHVIYSVDEFHYEINGWDDSFSFKPNFEEREDDSFDWVYKNIIGILTLIRDSKTGEVFTDFTPRRIIEKLRLSSPNQTKTNQYTSERDKKRIAEKIPIGIWESWYSEMAMGKAIKRHAKKMPLEDIIVKTLKEDDERESGTITVGDQEEKQDLNALLTSGKVNEETGEVVEAETEPEKKEEINERQQLTKTLISAGVVRSKALGTVKSLTDDEVSQYLSDPASIEALTAV